MGRALVMLLTLTFTLSFTRLQCFRSGDDTLTQGDYLERGRMTSASQEYSLSFFKDNFSNFFVLCT